MKVTITTMAGNTRNINLQSKQEVYDFIDLWFSLDKCIEIVPG